jgi:osmotically-inducible protein OsmY
MNEHDATQGFDASREAFGSGMQSFEGRGPKGYTRPDDRMAVRSKHADERSRSADQRLQEDVCERLTDEAWVDATDIEVTVRNREATLSGTVCDADQQRRAADVAQSTVGITNVTNNLRIAKSQGTDRAPRDPM